MIIELEDKYCKKIFHNPIKVLLICKYAALGIPFRFLFFISDIS